MKKTHKLIALFAILCIPIYLFMVAIRFFPQAFFSSADTGTIIWLVAALLLVLLEILIFRTAKIEKIKECQIIFGCVAVIHSITTLAVFFDFIFS